MADEPKDDVLVSVPDDEVKDSWLWIKDSRGYGSVSVTILCISFWVTTFAYILSLFEGEFHGFKLKPFDVGASSAYFGACLAMYTARKWTAAKYKTDDK